MSSPICNRTTLQRSWDVVSMKTKCNHTFLQSVPWYSHVFHKVLNLTPSLIRMTELFEDLSPPVHLLNDPNRCCCPLSTLLWKSWRRQNQNNHIFTWIREADAVKKKKTHAECVVCVLLQIESVSKKKKDQQIITFCFYFCFTQRPVSLESGL